MFSEKKLEGYEAPRLSLLWACKPLNLLLDMSSEATFEDLEDAGGY